jgi:hypothetical protein
VLLVVVIVLAVLTVVGVWLAIRWNARGPDEASVGEAVERFRSSSTQSRAADVLVPRAGVYTFSGSGEERLSFLSTSQPQGPVLPGTVTHGDSGCWTFQIEYNSFHRQTWDWCSRDGMLFEHGGTTHQQFDFVAFAVDETSRFTCDPPFVAVDPETEPGDAVTSRCTGRSGTSDTEVTSDGASRFVGRESVDIGGTPVPALHYEIRRNLTGDQEGDQRVDMWFAVADGMPLRNERELTVDSPAPAPLNSVTYTERGEFQLDSLEPRT